MPNNPIQAKVNRDRIAFQELMLRREVWQCCLNCNSWTGELCGKYNILPPPKVVALSCEEFESHIPF